MPTTSLSNAIEWHLLFQPLNELANKVLAPRVSAAVVLYAFKPRFAKTIAENYAKNEIHAKICFYLNSLSCQERLAAGDEYIEKFGYLLPEEMTESSAARIHDNLAKVLEKHVFMVYDLAKNTWKNRVQIKKEIIPKMEELKVKALQSFTTFLDQEPFRS